MGLLLCTGTVDKLMLYKLQEWALSLAEADNLYWLTQLAENRIRGCPVWLAEPNSDVVYLAPKAGLSFLGICNWTINKTSSQQKQRIYRFYCLPSCWLQMPLYVILFWHFHNSPLLTGLWSKDCMSWLEENKAGKQLSSKTIPFVASQCLGKCPFLTSRLQSFFT